MGHVTTAVLFFWIDGMGRGIVEQAGEWKQKKVFSTGTKSLHKPWKIITFAAAFH